MKRDGGSHREGERNKTEEKIIIPSATLDFCDADAKCRLDEWM